MRRLDTGIANEISIYGSLDQVCADLLSWQAIVFHSFLIQSDKCSGSFLQDGVAAAGKGMGTSSSQLQQLSI
jgi:hypothetical protein